MKLTNSILRFWAKTSHDPQNLPNAYHPLICHLTDVACVAIAMWKYLLPEVSRRRLAKPLGLENDLERAGMILAARISWNLRAVPISNTGLKLSIY